MRHGLLMATASDRYAESWPAQRDTYRPPQLADAIRSTASQIRRNLDVLITSLEFHRPRRSFPSPTTSTRGDSRPAAFLIKPLPPEHPTVDNALHALRPIDARRFNAAYRSRAPTTACCHPLVDRPGGDGLVFRAVHHNFGTHCRSRPRAWAAFELEPRPSPVAATGST